MNKQAAQLLEQHFDPAFAAPGGIARPQVTPQVSRLFYGHRG